MSETTHRAALKTILNSVSGIGQVHDYERWSSEWNVFLEKFATTSGGGKIVKGWTIACNGITLDTPPYDDEPSERFFLATYTYTIRGYYGLDDANASEKTALALALSVVKALVAGSDDIGGLFVPLPQLSAFEYRILSGVLVHYSEIEQQVQAMVRGATL